MNQAWSMTLALTVPLLCLGLLLLLSRLEDTLGDGLEQAKATTDPAPASSGDTGEKIAAA